MLALKLIVIFTALILAVFIFPLRISIFLGVVITTIIFWSKHKSIEPIFYTSIITIILGVLYLIASFIISTIV
jgi:hypothetical protein